MVRIIPHFDKTIFNQFIDKPLNTLARGPQVTGDMSHRLWHRRHGHCAQDLPTGAGQPEGRRQFVTGRHQEGVGSKNIKKKGA